MPFFCSNFYLEYTDLIVSFNYGLKNLKVRTLIEKEFGFIYLEKNEIAYYIANIWKGELFIQNCKNEKYSEVDIKNFHRELWKLINRNWDGKSAFRLT